MVESVVTVFRFQVVHVVVLKPPGDFHVVHVIAIKRPGGPGGFQGFQVVHVVALKLPGGFHHVVHVVSIKPPGGAGGSQVVLWLCLKPIGGYGVSRACVSTVRSRQ